MNNISRAASFRNYFLTFTPPPPPNICSNTALLLSRFA